MGPIPGSIFETVRVRAAAFQAPTWRLRLLMALASLLGLVVFLLLLPLILFAVVVFTVGLIAMRVRRWAMGLRRGIGPDDEGRRNVRVLVRDA